MRRRLKTRLIFRLLILAMASCQKTARTSTDRHDEPSAPAHLSELTPAQVRRIVVRGRGREKAEIKKAASARAEKSMTIDEALRGRHVNADRPILDRGLLDSMEHRHYTKNEQMARKKIMNALWQTPFGQMYLAYLTDDKSKTDIVAAAHQIVDRTYGEPNQTVTRIGALHLLTEDIYLSGMMDQNVLSRIVLLNGSLTSARVRASQNTPKELAYQAALFFIASLPFGSPIVRREGWKLLSIFGRNIKSLLTVNGFSGYPSESARLHLSSLFTRDVFKDYEIGKSVSFFFSTFGPFSMVFVFWTDWSQAVTGENVHDTLLLHGLDKLIDMANF